MLIQVDASQIMKNVVMHDFNVSGQINASGVIFLLDPVYIFHTPRPYIKSTGEKRNVRMGWEWGKGTGVNVEGGGGE